MLLLEVRLSGMQCVLLRLLVGTSQQCRCLDGGGAWRCCRYRWGHIGTERRKDNTVTAISQLMMIDHQHLRWIHHFHFKLSPYWIFCANHLATG
uniref:Putative secreted peptide n=1 Tax=Anopheles braziliensis TaxID=58242 RepID=A0A2M3ZQR4_9DIPT